MNQLISKKDKANYLQILAELRQNHTGLFPLRELSEHLGVSERKLSDFRAGKIIDFWLLAQYAGIIGRDLKFYLK